MGRYHWSLFTLKKVTPFIHRRAYLHFSFNSHTTMGWLFLLAPTLQVRKLSPERLSDLAKII